MAPIQPIIITVHGIRTFGQWHERLERLIKAENPDVDVKRYRYGYFSIIAFLLPVVRHLAVIAFRRRFRELVTANPGAPISIVAHSFGTHIVAWALRGMKAAELPNMPILILAGSVLKSDFDWSPLLRTKRFGHVVNDCGIDDDVLLLSQLCVLLTGMAGRVGFYGFSDSRLINRFFHGGHSHYFQSPNLDDDAFMRDRWLTILLQQSIPKDLDQTIVGGALQGVGYSLLRLADPIKLSAYFAVAFVLFNYGYLEPRRQAQIEQYRRQYQAAAMQLVTDRLVPTSVDSLAGLIARKSFREKADRERATDVARFGLQRLVTRDQAIAAMKSNALFRSGEGIYLKGEHVSRVNLRNPLAQFSIVGQSVVLAIADRGQSLANRQDSNAPGKKAEVVVFDVRTNAEIVRKDVHYDGRLSQNFSVHVVNKHPNLIMAALSFVEIEGDNGGQKIVAIDISKKTAVSFKSDDLLVNRACNEVAWYDRDDDDDTKTIGVTPFADLFIEKRHSVLRPRDASFSTAFSRSGLENCASVVEAVAIPALYFPRTAPEQSLFKTLSAIPASTQAAAKETCMLRGAGGDSAMDVQNELDLSELDADENDRGKEWFRHRLAGDVFCRVKLRGPNHTSYVAAVMAPGMFVGGWIICNLRDENRVGYCRMFSFASEGGGTLWHNGGDRYLVMGDAVTESNSTSFRVIDLVSGQIWSPDAQPPGQVISAAINDSRRVLLVATEVRGWAGAVEIFAYSFDGDAAHFIGRKRFHSGTPPASPLDRQTAVNPVAQFLFVDGRFILSMAPQTLSAVDVASQPWWRPVAEALNLSWINSLQFVDDMIPVLWTAQPLGPKTTGTVKIASRPDSSILAVFAGHELSLVLVADGTVLSPTINLSKLAQNCGEIASVSIENDDRLRIQMETCVIERAAPKSRDQIESMSRNLDVYLRQLE